MSGILRWKYNRAVGEAGHFVVADLTVRGDLQLQADYSYALLEQVPGALDLMAPLAAELYRCPEEFEIPLAGSHLAFRWKSCARTAGIATVRDGTQLASLSLLVCGLEAEADSITLAVFQRHLLRQWRDTEIEPGFALMGLTRRPLVATVNFASPARQSDRWRAALVDRCFGAVYLRYQHLA